MPNPRNPIHRPTTKRAALALAALGAGLLVGAAGAPPAPAESKLTALVPAPLLAQAQADGKAKFSVIVQGVPGQHPDQAVDNAVATDPGNARGWVRRLDLVNGGLVELTGKELIKLARMPGIAAITPDVIVKPSGFSNRQQWPYVSGVAEAWPAATSGRTPHPPTIAVVDSGIDTSRPDFGSRVVKQVTMTALPGNSSGDGSGHGTFVSGIAAGSAAGFTGAAPTADLLSIDVMNDQGMALTSDVIAAAGWIQQNKAAYNIRVANFSLHSTAPASVFWDPLDRAVEKLWLSGIVVVTAAGNYAVDGQASGVRYAPGNDPFVITVGANDIAGTVSTKDDTAAPWSAYGYTLDGFAKPEISAPGRYLVGPTSPGGTLALTRPTSVVSPGYIQLSGTSFAAPVVAGTAALLVAAHPDWTPDQVKGALLLTAKDTPSALPHSSGVGEVDAARALKLTTPPPNPNLALGRFVVADPDGGSTPVFDAASWGSAARSSASWGDASWGDASWGDASWGSASWGDTAWSAASWGTASWGDASWGDVVWGDASWGDTTYADNASADAGAPELLDAAQEIQAETELGITINADGSVSDLGPTPP
jgi:serine protease AprX